MDTWRILPFRCLLLYSVFFKELPLLELSRKWAPGKAPFTEIGFRRGLTKPASRSDRCCSPGEAGSGRVLRQRLVEDTERVGEDGGGKLRSSSTATPTLLRRVNMQEAATHLFVRGLYFSMELRLELPSFPPTA